MVICAVAQSATRFAYRATHCGSGQASTHCCQRCFEARAQHAALLSSSTRRVEGGSSHMISIQQGLVIAGKQSPSELIPVLLNELERLDPNAVLFGAPRANEIRRAIPQDPRWLESEDA